ncbi:6883_t:CDS:2, partial [Racocetra persica]
LLISYTAYNEDLESYYSFLGNSHHYVDFESEENEDCNNIIKISNPSTDTRSNPSHESLNSTPQSSIPAISISSKKKHTFSNLNSKLMAPFKLPVKKARLDHYPNQHQQIIQATGNKKQVTQEKDNDKQIQATNEEQAVQEIDNNYNQVKER